MIAAIVAPAGFLSIAMARACLVSGPAAGLDDAGSGRLRDAGLAVFRAVDRAVAFGLDLDLVMGSSEVCATTIRRTTSAPPGSVTRQGRTPSCLDYSKALQQRSDQTRKPANSEQDCCSLSRGRSASNTQHGVGVSQFLTPLRNSRILSRFRRGGGSCNFAISHQCTRNRPGVLALQYPKNSPRPAFTRGLHGQDWL